MSYYRTIENCLVSRTSSKVIWPYIDNEKSKWYKSYGGYHSGIDIECEYAHSVCEGVCTYIGIDKETKLYKVYVQYDTDRTFGYSNLLTTYVSPGDAIVDGLMIGDADRFVHFEYLSSAQDESIWPVRISSRDYYKHDPEDYADGTITLVGSGYSDITYISSDTVFDEPNWTASLLEEFTGGYGGVF